MNALDVWRREIRALAPEGFLRRDMGGDALFISDYPRRSAQKDAVTERLREAGFVVLEENGLAHLDGNIEKYRSFMAQFPAPAPVTPTEENLRLYALARRLERAGTDGDEQPLPLIRLTFKYLDAEDPDGLLRLLPPLLAEAQRKHQPLPGFAGRLIFHYLQDKEASSC